MKKSILLPSLILISLANFANAQTQSASSSPIITSKVIKTEIAKSDLKQIYITTDVNLHFRTPEPVQFVDLSTDRMIGDLPTENVVRIKILKSEDEKNLVSDTTRKSGQVRTKISNAQFYYTDLQELGVVTIVGQSFMAQYRLVYRAPQYSQTVQTNIEISPADMQPLEYPQVQFSNVELKKFALDILKAKPKTPIRKEKDMGITASLNSIYTLDNYVFLDLAFKNKSNLTYDIDELKFSIDDKKVYKSSNNQSIEIQPIFQLYNNKQFKRSYRNVYVFKKFTYPNNKVLNIRLVEQLVSGRTINLAVKYSDILQADTF